MVYQEPYCLRPSHLALIAPRDMRYLLSLGALLPCQVVVPRLARGPIPIRARFCIGLGLKWPLAAGRTTSTWHTHACRIGERRGQSSI